MAHELEIVNGNAQMAYVGNVPWHGLGTKVEEELTPAQFQEVAGLDWEVTKEKLRPVAPSSYYLVISNTARHERRTWVAHSIDIFWNEAVRGLQ